MTKYLLIIIGIVFLGILGFLAFSNFKTSQPPDTPQAETQKASASTQLTNIKTDSEGRIVSTEFDCKGEVIPTLTEGPYYKANSPEKTNLREDGVTGEKMTLTGYVLDQNCQAIKNAWVDFWQADGVGNYDNTGFKLRGHQFTNELGEYKLETVVPTGYSGRTPHIHVKLKASENSPIITTQLFIPDIKENDSDEIFNEAMTMEIKDSPDGKIASYNFVINN